MFWYLHTTIYSNVKYNKGGVKDIKHIGENIAKLRLTRGLTQVDLGREIGLTSSAISNIENATSYPYVDKLIGFANFFGVTMDYMLTDKGL